MSKPINKDYLLKSFQDFTIQNLDSDYVKLDGNKQLSSNDFTDEYKALIDYYYKIYVGE